MSTNEFTIRRLKPGDSHHVVALNQLYSDAFDDPENYSTNLPSEKYLDQLLDGEQTIILIALDPNDAVVGGLTAYLLPKPEQERSEIYIYDLAVAERARRNKIATKLVTAVDEIGREHSSHVTYVQADYGDEPAIALYSGLGNKEEVLHFDLDKIKEGKK